MRISSSLAVNGELKLLARRPGEDAFCAVELIQPTRRQMRVIQLHILTLISDYVEFN